MMVVQIQTEAALISSVRALTFGQITNITKNAEKVNTEPCIHRVIQLSNIVGCHLTVSTLTASRSSSLALLCEAARL